MEKPVIFYDGNCGLCHWAVRFVLNRDKSAVFNFSPQQGEALKNFMDKEVSSKMPDSVFVVDTEGKIYLKAFCVVFILEKLGGIWAFFAKVFQLIPIRLANYLYDFVAGMRYKVFSTKHEACPLVPPGLKARFLS
jgi:predicted DCC family thiol-disulfide oxidoreductase YuxK